jgi:hypothetical protein
MFAIEAPLIYDECVIQAGAGVRGRPMTQASDEYFVPSHPPFWRRKRWLFAGVAMIAAIGAVLFIASSMNEVSRQLRAIRARGEPVTAAELAEYYAVPPAGQDTTRLWMGAFDSLSRAAGAPPARKLPFLGDAGLPPPVGQPWADIELARQFLQSNAAAMRQLHEAAALGGQARYPIDFRSGLMALIDHAQHARSAARCLALEAHLRAHSDDMHGAAESLRTGLLLSESMKNEPLLVSQLVRIAIYSTFIERLKSIDPATFPPADLKRLQETLAHIEFNDGMKRAAVGERVLGLTAFDDPVSAGLPKQMVYLLWVNRGADELAYLGVMSEFVALSELPWNECIDQTNAWSNNLKTRFNRWTILTNNLTPALGKMIDAFARGESVNRLALVDVAIARYRGEHGRAPEALVALVPAYLEKVPLDPTTDKPFDYRATADGYLLYSPAKTLFGNATGHRTDPETGANPILVFRRPPLLDEPKGPVENDENDPVKKKEEGTDEAPADPPVELPADAAPDKDQS